MVVTWRPGAFSGAPLRPALGLGPGPGEATVVVRAFVPALRAICEQHVSLECLDSQLVKSAQYDEMVDCGALIVQALQGHALLANGPQRGW